MKSIPETFDVVVVGAGPAGSSAALAVAHEGFSVLLLEEHTKIGVPLQCAEGLSRSTVSGYLEIKPEWISANLQGSVIYGPDSRQFAIEYPNVGWILDRKLFDPALARMAQDEGTVLKTDAKVIGLEAGRIIVKEKASKTKYGYRFLIGADGIASMVGRWLGVDTRLVINEIEVCAQYYVEGINVRSTYTSLYVGQNYAPGGYAWVFPKSSTSANVGLGISPTKTKMPAKYYLDEWIKHEFPKSVIKQKIFGGVPAKVLKQFSGKNFYLVGDAARFTDPLSGAGIANSIKSGIIAGRCAALRLKNKKADYEKEIEKEILNELRFHKRVRHAYLRLSDKDFTNIFRVGEKIFAGKTVSDIDTKYITKKILFSMPQLMRIGFRLLF